MSPFGFVDPRINVALCQYFSAINTQLSDSYDNLRNEDNICGALQMLLMQEASLIPVQDAFRALGYDISVDFQPIREGHEPLTGLDLAIMLTVDCQPETDKSSFFEHVHFQKAILVQAKNLRTNYGTQIRLDQLSHVMERTESGAAVFFFSRKGIEVAAGKDFIRRNITRYSELPFGLKLRFSDFMVAFCCCNIGDHNPNLVAAIEQRNLSGYFRYSIHRT